MKKLFVLTALFSIGLMNANLKTDEDIKNDLRAQLEKTIQEELQDCFRRCELFKHKEEEPAFADGRVETCMKNQEQSCVQFCNVASVEKAKRLQFEAISRVALIPSQLINEDEKEELLHKIQKMQEDQNQNK